MDWEGIDRVPTLSGPAKVPEIWEKEEFWTAVHAECKRTSKLLEQYKQVRYADV